jgi:hypothetical protein
MTFLLFTLPFQLVQKRHPLSVSIKINQRRARVAPFPVIRDENVRRGQKQGFSLGLRWGYANLCGSAVQNSLYTRHRRELTGIAGNWDVSERCFGGLK